MALPADWQHKTDYCIESGDWTISKAFVKEGEEMATRYTLWHKSERVGPTFSSANDAIKHWEGVK